MDLYETAERLAIYLLNSLTATRDHKDILLILGMAQWFVLSQAPNCLELKMENIIRDSKKLIDKMIFPEIVN